MDKTKYFAIVDTLQDKLKKEPLKGVQIHLKTCKMRLNERKSREHGEKEV